MRRWLARAYDLPRPAKPARHAWYARVPAAWSSIDRHVERPADSFGDGATRACRVWRAGFAGRGMQLARATGRHVLAPAASRDRVADRRGFTFIELIVVLAIIGLAAAVAVPAIEGGLDTREVNRAARQLRAMMHFLSTEAVASGKDRRLRIKPTQNRIETDDGSRWVVLSERAQFERVLGGAVAGDGTVDILFYPNGSSSGADVVVASRRDRFGNRRRLVLDPLTCGVRVEDES